MSGEVAQDHQTDLLPMLAPAVLEALPAYDLERIQEFDQQFSQMVGLAREKGFSEGTIESIFALRERMYTERGAIWRQMTVFGDDMSVVEGLEDEAAARSWANERLADEVRAAVMPNTDEADQPYMLRETVPYFGAWLRSVGLEFSYSPLVKEIRQKYIAWLGDQADVVAGEAAEFLNAEALKDDNPSIIHAIHDASRGFHDLAFGTFDQQFLDHMEAGIEQLQKMDPLPPEEVETGIFKRLSKRVLPMADVMVDRKGLERDAMSDFFDVIKAMTETVSNFKDTGEVAEIVRTFKDVSGLRVLRDYVIHNAKVRIIDLVNPTTAENFLSQFDEDVDSYFDRVSGQYRRTYRDHGYTYEQHADSSQEEHKQEPDEGSSQDSNAWQGFDDVKKKAQERGPQKGEHVTWTHYSTMTHVKFDKTVLDDEKVFEKLTKVMGSAFERRHQNVTLTEPLIRELGAQVLASRVDETADKRNKRVFRSLVTKFHPDHQDHEVTDVTERVALQESAAIAGELYEIYKREELEVTKEGETAGVVVKEPRYVPKSESEQ